MAVNAGSIQEDTNQLGFAHFLEHMAFNGTRRFPANVLVDEVERAGMSFGADLNAYTSFDETVYQLTMPTDDSTSFHRGIEILYDWASGGILNDSLSVVGERGVVLGEWRARLADSSQRRFQRESMERIFGKGSRYVDRFPIGDPKLLESAEPAEIRRFYHDWYRPDRMAIIAVGDFDPRQIEQVVKAQFGAIPKSGKPRKFERPVQPASPKTTVRLVKENIAPQVEFTWPTPAIPRDPELAMRERFVEQIFLDYLKHVAAAMSTDKKGRSFTSANITRSGWLSRSLGESYIIRLVAHPDTLLQGFESILTELERISQHGIPSDALVKTKADILHGLEESANGSAVIQSRAIATGYVDHFLLGKEDKIWAPAQSLALANKLLPQITSREIAQFAARWRDGRGRIVSMNLPRVSTLNYLTEPTVAALMDTVAMRSVAATSPFLNGTSHQEQALHSSSQSGSITESHVISKAGVSEFTLSNGARVVVKSTVNNPDEVILHAYSQGGHSQLPDSLFYSPGRLVTFLLTSAGEIGGVSRQELDGELETNGLQGLNVELNAFDESMTVRGNPRELETLFRLMHTQFTNPTIDSAALEEWRRTGAQTIGLSGNDAIASQLGGHPRLGLGLRRTMFIEVEQAMRVYKNRFGDASDFTFYVVGAVDTQTVRPLLERYIANLPSTNRTTHETPKSFGIKAPSNIVASTNEHPGLPVERAHLELQFWGNVGGSSAIEGRDQRWRIRALSAILSHRLRNRLREEMAVTYSVAAPVRYYYTPECRYLMQISLVTAPNMIDTAASVIWEEIKALRTVGPSEDEAKKAHQMMRRQMENAGQDNMWWVAQFALDERNGLALEQTTLDLPFTAADIREAAIRYLPENIYTQRITKPDKRKIEEHQKETAKKAQ